MYRSGGASEGVGESVSEREGGGRGGEGEGELLPPLLLWLGCPPSARYWREKGERRWGDGEMRFLEGPGAAEAKRRSLTQGLRRDAIDHC